MKKTLTTLVFAALSGPALAGTVQVLVTDKDGKPVVDAVVLIDTAVKTAVQPAAAPVVILQEGLRFVPFLTVVPAGSTLRFINRDGYDHHVRSTPSGPLGNTSAVKSFELRLDAAEGTAASPNDEYKSPPPARKKGASPTADVKVDGPGVIGLGCHIHASMRGQVYVSSLPWFGKTDANGVASIEGVPDGAADLNVWHPDQLQEQPTQRLQVTPAPLKTPLQLNFTPRRRRG